MTASRPSPSWRLLFALIEQLLEFGFRFEVVLADTVYGDNATLINALINALTPPGTALCGRHPL